MSTLDPDYVIERFDGEYRWLSNFHLSPVRIRLTADDTEGFWCPTVEHAFQACKTLDRAERQRVALAPSPGAAKRQGRRVTLRPGWDALRVDVMRELLVQKFAPGSKLAEWLLATGFALLVEGNTWGDRFWGMTSGPDGSWQGENHLGLLLMSVRDELRGDC